MEKSTQQIMSYVFIVINVILGGCFCSVGCLETQPFEIRPEFLQPIAKAASRKNSTYSYVTDHLTYTSSDYFGVEATLDVYGLTLQPGQQSEGGIWITSGDGGQSSPIEGMYTGWHIHPGLYKDSRTHFYVGWESDLSYPPMGCFNMICDGFRKLSSSITPGDVINPVSSINGNKQYITVRIFKDKSSGDWNVYYGLNGSPKIVGYFPKSLLPAMIDKPVQLRFGGYVSHEKPAPSPPMGNGNAPSSGSAASVSSIKLIDADGNDHMANTNLRYYETRQDCYSLSRIDSGRFFYGGPGCTD
ncbi:hypothetical protein ACQ4PT_022434 [Festuca glaucescens]